MRLKHATFADNLAAAGKDAPLGLRAKLWTGKKILSGGAKTLDMADRAGTALAGQILAPGGTAAGAVGDIAGDVYEGLRGFKQMPLARWAAVGIPSALVFQQLAGQKSTGLVNEAIQEGRNVYANDNGFLEKKASLEARILEKTASVKTAGGMLQSLGSPDFIQGLAGLAGKTLHDPSMIGGAMAGGALGQVGNAIGALTGQSGDTFGYRMNKMINPLTSRVKADETFASSFFQTAGSETAKGLASLLKDMASKALAVTTQGPAHMAMVKNLSLSDGTISRADPELLSNAYHTMQKFAPTLATDENAVRSFLREAVMAGNGPDYASIANLAKAESAIVGKKA